MGAQVSPSGLMNAILNIRKFGLERKYLQKQDAREAEKLKSDMETARLARESLYGRSETLPLATPRQPLGGQPSKPGAITLRGLGTEERTMGIAEAEEAREQQEFDIEEAIRTVDKRPLTQEDVEKKIKNIAQMRGGKHFVSATLSFWEDISDHVGKGSILENYTRLNPKYKTAPIKTKLMKNLQIAKDEALKEEDTQEGRQEIIQNYNFHAEAVEKGTFVDSAFPVAAERTRIEAETLATKFGSTRAGLEFKREAERLKEGAEDTKDNLKALASRYQAQIGRYYSAKRGTGQFIADPNKEQVAMEALGSAENIAIQYVKTGGKPEDLGITAESIKADFEAGRIKEKKAIRLLQQLFGMK